jgi:hypothetical protein
MGGSFGNLAPPCFDFEYVRATWPLEIVEYVQRCRFNSLRLDHGGSIRNMVVVGAGFFLLN